MDAEATELPIGIVLVTHGNLADEFRSAQEHMATVCIGPEDDMEQRRTEILESVGAVDQGKGVIVLTDMFGGTPSNLAISIMEKAHVEVIAGANLPMLIKLASVRNTMSLAAAANEAQEAGRKYIRIASQVLAGD